MSQLFYQQRRKQVLAQMENKSFAVFFAGEAPHKTTDQHYAFTVNKSFYYLTGLARQQFILLLLKGPQSTHEILFIEEASDYATKWLGKRMTKEEASIQSQIAIEKIYYIDQFDKFLLDAVMSGSRRALIPTPQTIYLDLYRYQPKARSYGYQKMESFLEVTPEIRIQNSNPIVDSLRMFKDESEIESIGKAIQFAQIGLHDLFQTTKSGMNERELEARFTYITRKAGSQGLSFNPILASGANATTLHYEENNQVIEENTLVLCDLGTLADEYASDITRTFPASGRFTARQKELYQLVLSVNKTCIEFVRPGITMAELNQYAKKLLAEGAIQLGLIQEAAEIDKYYYHNVSHYLGLDVHDVGTYDQPLKPGIVLTIEPGIYVEEEGIGIRIEDDVLVIEGGSVNLSQGIIKEVEELEAMMKS